MTEAELASLADPHASSIFNPLDRAVIDYAVAMTQTPVDVEDTLFGRLRQHLSDPQIVELTAAIAWENYRARFNRALQMESEGFSEGAFCPVPNQPRPSLPQSA